jgi:hypothetical protein
MRRTSRCLPHPPRGLKPAFGWRPVVGPIAALLLGTSACTGAIDGFGDDPPASAPPVLDGRAGSTGGPIDRPAGTGGTAGMGGGAGAAGGRGVGGAGGGTAAEGKAGPMPLRRLTRREYNNTVRDLLGTKERPADQFPPDLDEAFMFKRAGSVSALDATMLQAAAESLAAEAVANLKSLLPCDPAPNEAACARQFVEQFGLRAFRRPLEAAEVQRMTALYTAGRSTLKLDFARSLGLVIEAMLQSSSFLYHFQGGGGPTLREGGLVRLGPYEIASRLSYFLWGTMPDKDLFAAAAAGKLGTAMEIEAMARKMLADPRAQETFATYFEEWLHLDALKELPKDGKVYPTWGDALKNAMAAETRSFVRSVLVEGDGRLSTLLTSRTGFVNEALGGAVYKMAQAPKGSALQKTTLDPAQRSGLFTQATFLALTGGSDGSSPIKRGVEMYERVLCRALPPPPQDVPPAKPASAGGTTRDRFAEHSREECGRACHQLFDDLGFAFENYDGIGAYRTTDNGLPVDASGAALLDGQEKKFRNAVELVGLLATSKDVLDCAATSWTRFALGRNEVTDDAASLAHASAALERAQGSLPELIVAITTARSFRYRSPASGEVLP